MYTIRKIPTCLCNDDRCATTSQDVPVQTDKYAKHTHNGTLEKYYSMSA